ncbi:hypothetical protein BY996DRAFT_6414291 [Phakopsora pachyrhizi]|nr:hypothetical protein BY996DRAFT_6414291 [Phakopsora pachyrhizi]
MLVSNPAWPTPNPDSKPRKYFREKDFSWGVPSLGSDCDGLLHGAKYFFPPAHDCPPVLTNDPAASPTQLAMEAEPEPASQTGPATVQEPEPEPVAKPKAKQSNCSLI